MGPVGLRPLGHVPRSLVLDIPRERRRSAHRYLSGPDANAAHDGAMRDDIPAEFLLDSFPPAIRDTGRALRSLILATVPGTVEAVRSGWRWIAYSLPEKGRVRNYAWIGPERKHIHLGFEHGILLADPEHILQGAEEKLRTFRYLTFDPEIDIDEAVLVDYLRRAAELAVMPPGARRALVASAGEPVIGRLADVPPDWELVAPEEPDRRNRGST